MIPLSLPELFIDRLGWLLIHSLWQFAAIAMIAALLLRAMRSASAIVRYGTCLLALSAMVLAPAVTYLYLPGEVAGATPIHPTSELASITAAHQAIIPSSPIETISEPARRQRPPIEPQIIDVSKSPPVAIEPAVPWRVSLKSAIAPWLGVFVTLWCLGVPLFALRPLMSWYTLRRLRRAGVSPVPAAVATALARAGERLGVRTKVRALQSTLTRVPMVVGYLRPVILLPACVATGLSASELEAILLHELAHIRRHDYLVNLLQTLVETLFFYHPAIWWISSRIRHERELRCDELAADALGDRANYGRALLALEELRSAAPVLSLSATGGSLLERIRRLANAETPRANPGGLVCVAFISAVLIGIGIWSVGYAGENVEIAKEKESQATKTEADGNSDDDSTATEAGVIKGTLIEASSGEPVADARVTLRNGRSRETTSDANGRFRFEDVPPRPRGYRLWAVRGNLVTPKTPVSQTIVKDSATFAPLELEMAEGKRATFRVASEASREPIAGAVVRFGFPDRRKVETGPDGAATVQGLLSEEYDITIEAEGHARGARQINLSQSETTAEYDVSLSPGGVVHGVVVDKQGEPIAGAEVVYNVSGSPYGFHGDDYRTDKAGEFRHRFLPLNKAVEVSVRKDDYIRREQIVTLSENPREMNVRITLPKRPPGGSIAGVVKDDKGNPIAGAIVANLSNGPESGRTTKTDEQGAFMLNELIEGFAGYHIRVTAEGFAPEYLAVEPGTAESPGSADFRLKPGHSIRGQVVNEDGEPLKGAHVSARSGAYGPGRFGKSLRTGEDGRFTFDSLPADVRFDINHSSYAHLLNQPLKLDGDEPVIVRFQPPGLLRGHVVDGRTNQPIPQFNVRLDFSPTRTPDDPRGTFDSKWSRPGSTFESDKGEFLIQPLLNGMPFQVIVEAEGYERSVIERAVAATADEAQELKIALKPARVMEPAAVSGRILDDQGQPAAGAQLRLIVSTEQPTGPEDNRFNWVLIKGGDLATKAYCEQFLSAVSDKEGRFAFQEIQPGNYLSLAYWGAGVPQGRSLAFDETRPGKTQEITIHLPEPGTIRGTIERDRFPNAGSVRLNRNSDAWHGYEMELKDDQSSFEFSHLPPGEYSVVVAAKPVRYTENGHTFARISPLAGKNVRLEEGETEELYFSEPDAEQR